MQVYLHLHKSFCQRRCIGWRSCLWHYQQIFVAWAWPDQELQCHWGLSLVTFLWYLTQKTVPLEKTQVANCRDMCSSSFTTRFADGRVSGEMEWLSHVAAAVVCGVQFYCIYLGNNKSHYFGSTLWPRDHWPLPEQNSCAQGMHQLAAEPDKSLQWRKALEIPLLFWFLWENSLFLCEGNVSHFCFSLNSGFWKSCKKIALFGSLLDRELIRWKYWTIIFWISTWRFNLKKILRECQDPTRMCESFRDL